MKSNPSRKSFQSQAKRLFEILNDNVFNYIAPNMEELERILIRKPPLDIEDSRRQTPLILAIRTGNFSLVKLLLSAGANANYNNGFGASPLCYAAQEGDAECIKCLIEHGADVNNDDLSGESPLTLAASNGHIECVKLLIDSGADVHHMTSSGKSALARSAANNHYDCAKLLVDRGANIANLKHIDRQLYEYYQTYQESERLKNHSRKQGKSDASLGI